MIVETTGLADPAPIINSLIPGGAPALGLRDRILVMRDGRTAQVSIHKPISQVTEGEVAHALAHLIEPRGAPSR